MDTILKAGLGTLAAVAVLGAGGIAIASADTEAPASNPVIQTPGSTDDSGDTFDDSDLTPSPAPLPSTAPAPSPSPTSGSDDDDDRLDDHGGDRDRSDDDDDDDRFDDHGGDRHDDDDDDDHGDDHGDDHDDD